MVGCQVVSSKLVDMMLNKGFVITAATVTSTSKFVNNYIV